MDLDLGLDLGSIMDTVKDVLPILSYLINMVEKMLNLLGFYFRDERTDIVTDPAAEG